MVKQLKEISSNESAFCIDSLVEGMLEVGWTFENITEKGISLTRSSEKNEFRARVSIDDIKNQGYSAAFYLSTDDFILAKGKEDFAYNNEPGLVFFLSPAVFGFISAYQNGDTNFGDMLLVRELYGEGKA